MFRVFSINNFIHKYLKPDIVISSCTYPLDIFVAYNIAKKSSAKLVFEIHDLWPLTPIELFGYSKYNPFIILLQYAETFAFKRSDKIISILPFPHDYVKSKGVDISKLLHVPNGVEVDINVPTIANCQTAESILMQLEDLQKNGYFVVGYFGYHG